MVKTSVQHNDTIQAFHRWIRSSEAQLPGIGGPELDPVCSFVCRSNLEVYFERPCQLENLLDAVLDSHERHAVDPDYVREHYLQSFAALLCIGQGRMIHHFQQYNSLRDQKLPHQTRPDDFPITTPDKFDDFNKAQWQFCASKLEYGMNARFKREDILPITHKEKIGEGGSAIIYKIVVDESYNSLRPRGYVIPKGRRRHMNTFVLKTYRTAEAEENYKAERDAYMKLRWAGKPSPHIIAYYGGFIHGNSYNIILEYADQGTLETFMRKTSSPSSPEDNLLFWDRLFDVTHGIMTIHGEIGNESSASQILSGIHQDVKPANILVFSGNGTSAYDCHFKIADLGLTHFRPNASESPSDLEAFGTRAYGAPETFRSHVDTESAPLQITKEVDMWSIGCVFSEVSVWAHHGWKGVSDYRRQRSAEIEAKGGGVGEHVFHFDGDLLHTVDNIHQDMLGEGTVKHLITRSVLDRLVIELLQHGSRPHAKLVFERSKRLVKDCEKRLGVSVFELGGNVDGQRVVPSKVRTRITSLQQVPHEHNHLRAGREPSLEEPLPPDDDSRPSSSPSKSQPSPHRHQHISASQNMHVVRNPPLLPPPTAANTRDMSSQQHVQQHHEPVPPTLSIDVGHVWKEKRQYLFSGRLPDLPGCEYLISLRRDHMFLIDNSATMKQYKEKIERVVSLLAYMVKTFDQKRLDKARLDKERAKPVSIDMSFTQTMTKVNLQKNSKTSAPINQVPFFEASDMRKRLQTILQEHINQFGTSYQPPRPTFGRQKPPEPQKPLSLYVLTDAKWQPTDVEGLIKDLVQSMIAKNCPKEHVAIQFIRFGDDQASIEKLDALDHGLGLQASGMGIVDHTYWDGNVWKMLLGALYDWYDDPR